MNSERKRLGVAYLLRGAARERAEALRQRFDPRSARALPAHVTLAGPVNVDTPLAEVRKALERVAQSTRPFPVAIGGVSTFAPVSCTTFLEVEPREALAELNGTLRAELGWTAGYPYHPHVTVTEYLDPQSTEAVYRELARDVRNGEVLPDYLDRMTLLQKEGDGTWSEVETFELAAPRKQKDPSPGSEGSG